MGRNEFSENELAEKERSLMSRQAGNSFKIAYCGITVALSVIIMIAALIPSFTYLLPAVSGIIIWTAADRLGRKWGILAYGASAALCFILIPEIEADLYYLFFFGYYPIVKELIERLKPKVSAFIVKLAVFNASVVIAFQILSRIMNLEDILDGLEGFGDMAVYVLWGAANIAFVVYDICLGTLFMAFRRWLKPKIFNKLK